VLYPLLLLHAGGWDELLMLAGALVLAYFIIKLTSGGGSDEDSEGSGEETAEVSAEPAVDGD
jgi:hypothetical protein